jgi:hypothetical protein
MRRHPRRFRAQKGISSLTSGEQLFMRRLEIHNGLPSLRALSHWGSSTHIGAVGAFRAGASHGMLHRAPWPIQTEWMLMRVNRTETLPPSARQITTPRACAKTCRHPGQAVTRFSFPEVPFQDLLWSKAHPGKM